MRVKADIIIGPKPLKIHFPIPQPTKHFTGRKQYFSELHTLLQQNKTVLINGVGGIGKTSVAAQYAHQYKKEYSTIVWLDYRDSFNLSFLQLNNCFNFKGIE